MKIKVIANKSWEATPLVNALLNPKFKPVTLPSPIFINEPESNPKNPLHQPRLVYQFNMHTIEIWCLEDQMNPNISTSSSLEKVKVLPNIIMDGEETPDLVIAFGTAGTPLAGNNGGVSIGSYFINYSGIDPSNKTPWDGNINDENYMNSVLHRAISTDIKNLFVSCNFSELYAKFLSVPLNPSPNPQVVIGETDNLAVSDTNIIDYRCYQTEDKEAVKASTKLSKNPIVSVETTHGIIAATTFAYTDAPVIFISAITDQVGYFDQEVSKKPEAQNYTAAFNGGIYLSYVLANLGTN